MDMSFKSMIETDYGIKLTDEQYLRLTDTLNMYGVNANNINIEVESNLENFINNIHLTKIFQFKKAHTLVEIEDVIYSMVPITYGSYEKFDLLYPKYYRNTTDRDIEHINCKIKQNIVLIRRLKFDSHDEDKVCKNHYTLMIYNKNLNIHAGIRFENI